METPTACHIVEAATNGPTEMAKNILPIAEFPTCYTDYVVVIGPLSAKQVEKKLSGIAIAKPTLWSYLKP